MRNKVLMFALTFLLMLLCIPSKAQQSQGDSTVSLTQLTADMIANVKPYVRPKVLAKYIIEIGDISEETMARPRDGREGYTQNIYKKPEGITVGELIFSLPDITKDQSGKLITKEGEKIVRTIYFNEQPVLPDDSNQRYYTNDTKLIIAPWSSDLCSQRYKDDTKLNSGTVYVKIKENDGSLQGSQIIIEYYQNVSYEMVGGNSEYVDLGLSVKWASRNIGAAGPEEIGEFYYWGETEPRYGIESSLTYKFRDGHKYNGTDGKTVLDPEDDVAHVKWGGSWRMPTTKEIDELIKNCTWSWASVNGEIGFLITSNKRRYTDRSIFLPYYYAGTSGDVGYWSSSFNPSPDCGSASLWICFDGNIKSGYCYRNWQLPVRPVCP